MWAPAKINLNLLVGPRRDDGFHPVDSFVAKITLYDLIDLRLREDRNIVFSCSGADCGCDEENLALRAGRLLAQGRRVGGADVSLTKGIQPGKGLGGGSSDAAAVLAGLNELWKLRLGQDELLALAGQLGSDVPLFLGAPAARVRGRGELVEPVAVRPFHAVLYVGDFSCNTAEVYRAYDSASVRMARQLDATMLASQPPSKWRGGLKNQLADAAKSVCGDLADTWSSLADAVGPAVCMTGSGSALFVLCDDETEASGVLAAVGDRFRSDCLVVRHNPW